MVLTDWGGDISRLQAIYTKISMFVNAIINILAYIRDILQSLWYWLTTLLTWVMDIIEKIFTSWIF